MAGTMGQGVIYVGRRCLVEARGQHTPKILFSRYKHSTDMSMHRQDSGCSITDQPSMPRLVSGTRTTGIVKRKRVAKRWEHNEPSRERLFCGPPAKGWGVPKVRV